MAGIDVGHIMEHADKIKNKALYQLEQKLAAPINEFLGHPELRVPAACENSTCTAE